MSDGLEALRGQTVIVDLASQYVVLGVLVGFEGTYLVLEEADVHDLRDTTTNREQYVVEARRHGIQVNRKVTRLRQAEIVCISRLEDVLV